MRCTIIDKRAIVHARGPVEAGSGRRKTELLGGEHMRMVRHPRRYSKGRIRTKDRASEAPMLISIGRHREIPLTSARKFASLLGSEASHPQCYTSCRHGSYDLLVS